MKISLLIPCHNEEKSIKYCVLSCLNQTVKANEIIVVNDGSTDNSLNILKKFKNQIKIINISKPTGNKSYAQEKGLKYVTGDILITTDGDTIMDSDFVKNIISEFKDKNVIAVSGYVKSRKENWLTACRQIEYIIGQEIHKTAQAYINAQFVIPGCAAAFRTNIFRKHISFDHDTLTEDLDFTFKHHEKSLKIKFCKKAVVYTQDPSTLADYVNQIRRWNAGNWQNLIKHREIFKKPNNAFELTLIYAEGLVFPLLLLTALLLNFNVFLLFSISYLIIISSFAIFGAIKNKRFDLILFTPVYFFISFINYAVFIEQFILEVILQKRNLVWFQPARKAII